MDGVHDAGGRQGFGPVRYETSNDVFKAAWEPRANALYSASENVRVKNEFVSGHVRMPDCILGKIGVVVSISPLYPDEPTYDVRFRAEDL